MEAESAQASAWALSALHVTWFDSVSRYGTEEDLPGESGLGDQ
jgi:hypothetical protein